MSDSDSSTGSDETLTHTPRTRRPRIQSQSQQDHEDWEKSSQQRGRNILRTPRQRSLGGSGHDSGTLSSEHEPTVTSGQAWRRLIQQRLPPASSSPRSAGGQSQGLESIPEVEEDAQYGHIPLTLEDTPTGYSSRSPFPPRQRGSDSDSEIDEEEQYEGEDPEGEVIFIGLGHMTEHASPSQSAKRQRSSDINSRTNKEEEEVIFVGFQPQTDALPSTLDMSSSGRPEYGAREGRGWISKLSTRIHSQIDS